VRSFATRVDDVDDVNDTKAVASHWLSLSHDLTASRANGEHPRQTAAGVQRSCSQGKTRSVEMIGSHQPGVKGSIGTRGCRDDARDEQRKPSHPYLHEDIAATDSAARWYLVLDAAYGAATPFTESVRRTGYEDGPR
jgi:hypothetical protein